MTIAANSGDANFYYEAIFTNVTNGTTNNVTTNAVQLTVTAPVAPQITLQPTPQSATSGFSATFTSTASGSPPPSVAWSQSPTGAPGSFTAINTATNPSAATTSLTVTASASDSNYYYEATFNNSGGSITSNAVQLTVTAPVPPSVTTQPSNASVVADQSNTATFNADATGTLSGPSTPIAVQWQVNKNDGNGWVNLSNGSTVTGATTGTLTVTPADSDNGNQYRAVFSNAPETNTTATSNPATLTLLASGTAITNWSFGSTVVAPPDNSPPTTSGTGTASSLGFDNSYTTPASVTEDDILATPGTLNKNFTESTWRVRGGASPSSAGTPDGWSTSAPQYSQGVEFDASTAGYRSVYATFDWYATAQAVRDLQIQYNLNTGNANGWTNLGTPIQATAGDYYGPTGSSYPTQVVADLTGVPGASNDANLGIRMVGAYDAGLTSQYAVATLDSNGNPVAGAAGNWRFGDVSFSGTSTATNNLPVYINPSFQASYNWNESTGTLSVSGGTLTFNADSATDTTDPSPKLTVTGATAHAVFNSSQHLTGLTLGSNATATVASLGNARTHANHSVLVIGTVAGSTPTFSVDTSSTLDMMDNDLIVHHGNLTTEISMR